MASRPLILQTISMESSICFQARDFTTHLSGVFYLLPGKRCLNPLHYSLLTKYRLVIFFLSPLQLNIPPAFRQMILQSFTMEFSTCFQAGDFASWQMILRSTSGNFLPSSRQVVYSPRPQNLVPVSWQVILRPLQCNLLPASRKVISQSTSVNLLLNSRQVVVIYSPLKFYGPFPRNLLLASMQVILQSVQWSSGHIQPECNTVY